MFSVKFSAAIAAVLLISGGAAQAGGRPCLDSGIGSSPATVLAWPIEDRGQANRRLIRSGPVSTTRLASQHRPVSKAASIRFAGVPYPDRRGLFISQSDARKGLSITSGMSGNPFSISVGLKALAAGDIRFADRVVTSSFSKAAPLSTHSAFVKFCIGSMAPQFFSDPHSPKCSSNRPLGGVRGQGWDPAADYVTRLLLQELARKAK